MRHVYECPLRWADLDLLGHVSNVTYVDYLQEARVDLFRTHARDQRADDLAEGVVVVRHEVTYVSSLTFRFAPVLVECWVTEIRGASFTMAYEVYDQDESGERQVYLRASTLLTPFVFAEERPRRLRADEVTALERLLELGELVRPPAPATPLVVPGGDYPVHVRFSDVDVYGHVNNVKYFEYFQEARIQLMRSLIAPEKAPEDPLGIHLVVAQTDVDYKRPILFRATPYVCRTWASHIGRTSVVFDSVVYDDDAVLARARVVVVCVDNATGRPTPVPEHFRSATGAPAP